MSTREIISRMFKSAGPVTLVKKIGDEVLVSVDIADMKPANFIGFQLNYPPYILAPVLVAGSDHAVQYEMSETFGALDCDLQVNIQRDDQTLAEYVYFSKAVKSLAVSTMANSRLATIHFRAVAAGTGELTVTARKYGKIEPSGDITEYDSTSDPLTFELQESHAPEPVVVAKFKIVVE